MVVDDIRDSYISINTVRRTGTPSGTDPKLGHTNHDGRLFLFFRFP